jgi:hypothetical protein
VTAIGQYYCRTRLKKQSDAAFRRAKTDPACRLRRRCHSR